MTAQLSGAPAVPASRAPASGRRAVLAVLAAVAFMAQLDLFIVNVAVPAMGRSFDGAGLGGLSWVLNAYAIVFAALLVPAGRLADHYGRRRFLLIGVTVFTLASVVCAAAPTLGVLVAGRAAQAVGAAMIVPTSLGLLLPSFPPEHHQRVVGIWAGVAAVAATSGPPIGGLLVAVDWRWIFLVNVPIGVATIVAGRVLLPEIRAEAGARLPDPVSVVTAFAAIALFTLATVQGPAWGWGSLGEVLLLAVAVVAAVVTVRRAMTKEHAVVEAALFRSRTFATSTVALFLFFLAFAAWLLITVLFLQDVWGYSALRAGLAIAPGPATAAVFALNAGRISARFGRTPAVIGPLLVAGGAVSWIALVGTHPAYVTAFLPGLLVTGVASGLTQAPLFAAAGTLPPHRAGTGSAVLNMARQAGSALGVAVLVAVLGAAHPTALAAYHRGWWFLAGAALSAAAAIVVGSRTRPAADPAVPAGAPLGSRAG